MTSIPSFDKLYDKHKDLVYNLCLNYLQNKEDAEEVFQDVFIKVNKKFLSFNQKSTYKTWIYRISINTCLDFIRAKNRKKRFAFIQSLSNSVIQIASPFSHPGIALEHKEALGKLFKQINELPEKQKTALILKSIDGLSQKEMAEVLNISEKAVESLLSRARKNLKEKRGEEKD